MSNSTTSYSSIDTVDVVVIVLYFLFVFSIGLYSTIVSGVKRFLKYWRERKNGRHMIVGDEDDPYREVAMQPIPSKDSLMMTANETTETTHKNGHSMSDMTVGVVDDDDNEIALKEVDLGFEQRPTQNSDVILATKPTTTTQQEPSNVESDEEAQNVKKGSKNFFLADGNVGFVAIACSLFASNIGAEHILGLSSSGASIGLAVGMAEVYSPIWILVLGWLFIPFYLKTQVFTLPEFIEKRFDRTCRMYLSMMSLVMYVMTKISVSIYAGVVVFKVLLGWDVWISAAAVVISTGIYTILGGLSAVIYTEVLQTFVMIIGATILFVQGMIKVGGYSGLQKNLPDSMMHLFQPPSHHDFPVTGVLFGMTWTSMWYWCTDQSIVQRALAAKDLANAIRGCVLAALIKFLPLFLMVIPGMIARVLIPEVKDDPNSAYILLITKLAPPGLKGLLLSAIIAALMSSLASLFHSSSTLFTMDFYRVVREYFDKRRIMKNAQPIVSTTPRENASGTIPADPNTVEFDLPNRNTEYVVVGKLAGAVVTVIGLLFIPVVQVLSKQLYIYTHKIMGYLAAPIAVIFLMGVLFKSPNQYGCLFTLILGNTLGLARLFLEALFNGTSFNMYQLPPVARVILDNYIHSNFLHFSACMALFSIISLFVVSWITGSSSPEKTEQLTLNYSQIIRSAREFISQQQSFSTALKENSGHVVNVIFTIVVLMTLFTLYIIFR
ncbi:hypothetical protein C9374_010099 [Naegleria lovaniensis]|uniref:Sodium/solute symporter n=1 Tax=Naegleria lovaniensis TaxID=51637 RepID=A0AA88KDX8_NAELO|nr:uncharacterized protein C9374_010099 [Naegleria lovaniensis]KAG2375095.1 hypothetical protein C9374_010099 [Naegleria lovaniensis]